MIRAEWVKFRSVRGWVVAVVLATVTIVGLGLGGGDQGTCYGNSCAQLTGPGGEAVSDSFYFVHQALMGNGSLTVRVTSLASAVGVPHGGTRRTAVPWAKAGIILKATLTPGSAYAAIMVTGSHGVRMQDDFTGDIAGPAMPADCRSMPSKTAARIHSRIVNAPTRLAAPLSRLAVFPTHVPNCD